MKNEDSIFGATPEGLERLVSEAWQHSEPVQQERPTIPAQMLLEEPGGQIGRYKLLSVLGEGGMGIVFLAEQERPVRRQVALKVIKPGMDSKRVLARFEAEQQALALMEHPNVARVHDAGLAPSGRPYFVMEHVKGLPITEHCDKYRLTIEERLQLFIDVCEAVQYAHQKGIIHRDIKPSNILVTIESEKATPKVIDFGVARAINQPLTERTLVTEQGQFIGTPEYMSPEQADPSNQDIDTRTDVYSLGVVLYELIAGVLPFDPCMLREHGIDSVRKVICEDDPQTPSTKLNRTSIEKSNNFARQRRINLKQLQRKLRGDLDWITLKAMEKDRTRRYSSAGELAADIRRHLGNEPVWAGRPNIVYKALKFVRRNRALVSGLAAVLVVLLTGIVISLIFAVRANRASHEATVIAEFLLEDVFEAFDGWDRGGRQITIKDFLDASSEKVSDKFKDMPLLEASIRKTLGDLYLKVDVDNFTGAENHLNRSLDILTRQVGRNDIRTIEVVDLLGQMYWHRWQYQEAAKYLSEALPAKGRLLGRDNPETLETMAWLGWACYGNGHAKRAEELLTEAYTTARRTLGEKDRITIESMLYYGGTLILRGRYAEAEGMLADALRIAQGILSPEHPFMLYPAALLGRLYSREGRYVEAEKILSNALATSRKAWGEKNGGTFHSMAALAENYARQGLIEDAEKLMLDAVGKGNGSDSPPREISIQNLTYLGFFCLSQRNYNEAEQWAIKALKASLESNGESHPITFLPRMALGIVYREQCRYDEAEMEFTKLLPALESYITDENIHVANTMHQLAALYQQEGKYAEAEKLHLGILKMRRNQLVENHPHTLSTIRGLIALYTAWGKPREAQKWFAELCTAYAQESAVHQSIDEGNMDYNSTAEIYTLLASPLAPWAMEKELDFSYPEPTSEVWHICDNLHFGYKKLQEDGSIAAKIEKIHPTYYGASAGLMIRKTLDPSSPQASIMITSIGEVIFQYRTIELGALQSIYDTIQNVELPIWLRLTRKGNRFIAQHSSDGVTWRTLTPDIEILMGKPAYVGLAAASGNYANSIQTEISHVSIKGSTTTSGPLTYLTEINLRP